MSLVNDMLRDLDRRGAGRPGDRQTDSPALSGNRSQGQTSYPPVWLWLLMGALLGAGALVAVGFWSYSATQQEHNPELGTPGIAKSGPEPTTQPGVFEVDRPNPQAPAETEPETLSRVLIQDHLPGQRTPETDASNSQSHALSRLLRQAEDARSRDRLTRPAGDNAYDYYQQVLAMEPGHAEARSGLAAIARRYTEMAETALDAGRFSLARQFIRRGLSVESDHPGLQQSRQRLENLASTRHSDPDTEADINQSANRQPEASPPAKDPAATGPEPHMQMNLDAETRDRRAARRGRELLAAGDLSAARQHLRSNLRTWAEPESPPAHTTRALVELYLREGDYVLAKNLLQASEALPKLELHRLWAELEQARGRPQAAIDWLESELGSARDDEHYRSLLARLYYSEGQQEQAAQSYSRLLADFGGRPAYWLGLGLVRDAQDRDPDALEAFRRAQASGAYERNPEIADYLKRRIAALQRQTQVSEP